MRLVKLSDKEMAALGEISKGGIKRFVYPEFGINFGFPDKQ
jgi:glycerol 2-dehydrogenase (NADP+)